ncbi:MAG: acyl carrier protein [Candidatus Glassbacteria bacterium]|nr:acyl carrier protein [Candidatus Glassbacteria bacterium]
MDDLRARVVKIVGRVMDLPAELLDEKSSMDDVESWDSLRHMNLVMALEEEFGLSFTDEEIVEMLSVEIILETLKSRR